jgi:hypothetical protein
MPDSTIPDWVEEAPDEPVYHLAMIDYTTTCTALQEVKVTRAEYIALKTHLALMRGLVLAPGPDVCQRELAAVVTHYGITRKLALQIRRRIEAGANVEEGQYRASAEDDGVPIEEMETVDISAGATMCGLDVLRHNEASDAG